MRVPSPCEKIYWARGGQQYLRVWIESDSNVLSRVVSVPSFIAYKIPNLLSICPHIIYPLPSISNIHQSKRQKHI